MKIKGFRALVKKFVRQNDSKSSAITQAFDEIPAEQLKGNKGQVRAAINEEFAKEGVKAKARKGQTKKLERKASESQARETDTPQTEALVKLGDALKARPKRDLDPTKTREEAGRSAARVAMSMLSKQGKALQNSYNGKKAQLAWLKKNDPQAPLIRDLEKEMKKLEARAPIDTGVSVSPKRPVGAKTPDELQNERRMQAIRQASKNRKMVEREGKALSDEVTKSEMSRGGAVKKKAIGHMDYRMNKGGLLLSSVDNRKKR